MASPQLPRTMKGILIEKTGGTDVLQYCTDLPVPEPKEGEVLVKNEFIGINYIDTYFRTGLYPSPKPEILGKEAAGTIVTLGPNVSGFSPSDRVVFLSGSNNNTYAEYSAAQAAKTIKIPEAVSSQDACAALLQGITALTLVEEAYKVQKGDWVLVLAASGGVGGWLCQVLKAKGAYTIATVGSEEKVQVAKDAGAEVVCVESEGGVVETVKKLTGWEGVAAVFDGVGNSTFERSLECVKRKGSLVSFGNASGAVEPFAISRLSSKNVKVARPTMFNYIFSREEFEYYAHELWRLMTEEKFKTRIHKIYPLTNAAKAHDDLEGRKTMGKLLMKP